MKKLATIVVLAGAGLLAGCASWNVSPTPVMTESERDEQIGRYWALQWQELADDTDYALLLRPNSHLSQWNVFHRD
jgi:hypothetical protein